MAWAGSHIPREHWERGHRRNSCPPVQPRGCFPSRHPGITNSGKPGPVTEGPAWQERMSRWQMRFTGMGRKESSDLSPLVCHPPASGQAQPAARGQGRPGEPGARSAGRRTPATALLAQQAPGGPGPARRRAQKGAARALPLSFSSLLTVDSLG